MTIDVKLASLDLLDEPTRRRFFISVALSAVVALLEVAALGLLYSLVGLASAGKSPSGVVPDVAARVGIHGRDALIIWLALIICIVYISKAIIALSLRKWTIRLLLKAESRVQESLFTCYLEAPLSYHATHNSAVFIRNLTQTLPDALSRGLNALSMLLTDGLLLLSTFAILLVLQPIPAVAGAVYFSALGLVVHRVIRPRYVRAAHQYMDESEVVIRTLSHAFGGIREILVAGHQAIFSRLLATSRSEIVDSQTSTLFYSELPRHILETGLVLAVVPLMAAVLTLGQNYSAAGIVLFAAVGFRALPSVSRLLANSSAAAYSRVAAREIAQAQAKVAAMMEPEIAPTPFADAPSFGDRISFEDVSFSYGVPGSDLVLNELTFSIDAGQYVGIVGESGAGKSTLLDLLVGLQQPTSGRITIDGVDLRDVRSGWRELIGYVAQQTFLLDRSVLENVAFGELAVDGVDEARVWAALRAAHLDEVIRLLPEGLETTLGERGVRLSGGQQQRVGIARALYRSPRLLVLDEATSALDTDTAMEILRAVEEFRGDMTIVVVTHRLASLERCDRVFRVGSTQRVEEISTGLVTKPVNSTASGLSPK